MNTTAFMTHESRAKETATCHRLCGMSQSDLHHTHINESYHTYEYATRTHSYHTGSFACHRLLLCADAQTSCVFLWLFCGNTGLFCENMGLFCVPQTAYCADAQTSCVFLWLFCGNTGLFCENMGLFCVPQAAYCADVHTSSYVVGQKYRALLRSFRALVCYSAWMCKRALSLGCRALFCR